MESIELAKNTVVGILKAGCRAEAFVGTTLKSSGITLQQFNVLRILRGRKGVPANLQTVQKRMIHKMSNTTRLIDKLIEKKLVVRKICKDNRRKIEILITDKGLEVLDQLDAKIQETEAAILQPLSLEEQKTLRSLINKITLNR
ncbi:MAG: MarR family transcriptional regulator [Flavobacteriaceae bacterium TMED42]|nr:MAG: MarR family transcriptional regulator [Flavobacteriaceae bacterium TMED42]|tara:strand:- start:1522 stop:1953 length:432 start_codon:yes stop_codon:yes gene_type:complete